jgi:hypothetical protein
MGTFKINWIKSDKNIDYWKTQPVVYVSYQDQILPVTITNDGVVCQDERLENYDFVEPVILDGRIFKKGQIIKRLSDLELDRSVIEQYDLNFQK